MASRTAKVASSIVAGILAGAPLTAPRSPANAAAECLTEAGQDAAQGQHWYYRIEHGTKRHCWYLREEGGKASQTAPSDDSAEAPKEAARNSENPPRSVEDARAEFPMPQRRESAGAAPLPAPAPLVSSPTLTTPPQAAGAQGSAVAARWPSPETAAAPAEPPPAEEATDPAPAGDAAPDASAVAPAPPSVAVSAAPAKPSASLQMLFAVIGGALALAGLTASIVYRLGRRRQRRLDPRERRAAIWEGVDTGPRAPWVEPVIEETAPRPTPERRAAQRATPHERYEKIEEILAQLVKQGEQSNA